MKTRPYSISFANEEKITRDSFKDECDVNNIVKTYTETGLVNHVAKSPGQYGDAPEGDYFAAACVNRDIQSQQEAGELDLEEVLKPAEAETENVPPEESQEASEAPEATTEDGA